MGLLGVVMFGAGTAIGVFPCVARGQSSRLGASAGLVILVVGLGADWHPYALIGVWAMAGLLYWALWARRHKTNAQSDEDRR